MEENHVACRGEVDACLVCSFEFHVSLCFFSFFLNDGLKWYWHNVIAVQCSECQCGEKFKTSAGERQGETMPLLKVATSALNVKVVENKRG